MVTKLSDGRGQSTLKGKEVDAEWEALVRKAAERTGSTVAAFVVHHTREAAQAILKGEAVGPAVLPARIEDVAASLSEQLQAIAERQDAAAVEQADRLSALAIEQTAQLARIERQARRGRWRR